jgi:hypothetical protein
MITGNLSQIQGLPTSNRISHGNHTCGSSRDTGPGPLGEGRFCDTGGVIVDSYHRNVGHGNGGCPHVQCSSLERGYSVGAGRLARLDRNFPPFLNGVQMCYFPGHFFFQICCTTIDGQLLYNFVNKKLSILHYGSISYVGIVQI